MKSFIHKIGLVIIPFAATLTMGSCISQMALDIALRRNVREDEKKYNKILGKYTAKSPEWTEGLKDTVMFSPNDGAKLHAIYRYAPTPTTKTAFILHGHTVNAPSTIKLAMWYNQELGYNVFMPDFYAHGLSEGKMRRMGWLDRFDFIEWMKMADDIFSPGEGHTDMVVTGISMGGASTMIVSAEVEERKMDFVKCFVEDCGYSNFYDEATWVARSISILPQDETKLRSILDKTDQMCKDKNGWSFKECDALSQVSRCHLPMLFIHGDADTYVPPTMAYQAYQAKAGERQLLIVPGKEHARAMNSDLYKDTVKAFVSKYIK